MICSEYKKRGKRIIKQVSEVYLDDSPPCGLKDSTSCLQQLGMLECRNILILDTECYSNQLELISNSAITNVLILQSQIYQLASKKDLYMNVKMMVENSVNTFYVFADRLCKQIQQNLVGKDRTEIQMIEQTLRYYQHQMNINGLCGNFQLIISNVAVYQGLKALEDQQIEVVLLYDWIRGQGNNQLMDFMGYQNIYRKRVQQQIYDRYNEQEVIRERVRKGELVQGKFRVRDDWQNGKVVFWIRKQRVEVLVDGKYNVNRAINNDRVVLEIESRNNWVKKQMFNDRLEFDQNDHEQVDEQVQEQLEGQTQFVDDLVNGKYEIRGKIVGVLERGKKKYCGEIEYVQKTEDNKYIFKPSDPKVSPFQIFSENIEKLKEMKLQVILDDWPETEEYPLCHLNKVIGKSGDIKTEGDVILLEHNVEYSEFSKKVLDCLPKEGSNYKISDEELNRRRDLRNEIVFSVDPPGCKDIDDALSIKQIGGDIYELGVHIADVTHFVKSGSEIDKEAQNRCTTVYLVDRRTDMIPKLLTEQLCSLREQQDRLAFSCIWKYDIKQQKIIDTEYCKTVIRSVKAFTYQQAQQIIDDPKDNSQIAINLRNMNIVAKQLKNKRNVKGALSLASLAVKFKYDSEDIHQPSDVQLYELYETNSMIEEFMLLANVSVAAKILDHYPGNSVLRRHSSPKECIKQCSELLGSLGLEIDYTSNFNLQKSLSRLEKQIGPCFKFQMIKTLITRSMNEAEYFCTHNYSYPEYYHYGLACDLYTHFTSPIRRYADILVHRLLAASIDWEALSGILIDNQKLNKACDKMNLRNRMARFAGRASSDYHTYLFFKNRDIQEEGIVSAISLEGFTVVLPRYGLEGFIKFSQQQSEQNLLFFKEQSPNITRFYLGDQVIQLFQYINVKVSVHMKYFHKSIDLQFVSLVQ